MASPRRFHQHTIALVYDFDGTLTPLPMQEYTVLPKLGVVGKRFWSEVDAEAERTNADPMLTYLRLLVERLAARDEHLTREDLGRLARRIRYFPGVASWFGRIDDYVAAQGSGRVRIRHYLVSAGHKEILEAVAIRGAFHRVYASEYAFDSRGRATFPKVVVNDTMKTQCLFRINKGRERISQSINDHMPEAERAIPFQQMIYIGDGLTDVPSMAVTKKGGGHAVAVYRPGSTTGLATGRRLLDAGRVDFVAPADYRARKPLERRVRLLLDLVIAKILCAREAFADGAGR